MIKIKIVTLLIICTFSNLLYGQDFEEIKIDSEVTDVQPMTGIVLWTTSSAKNTDAISLEYSYMSYASVVIGDEEYDWEPIDDLLESVESRNHQAILRFRFSYPGKSTTVPDYIKDLPDYNETEGVSEGKNTFFPDWTHPELQEMTLDFYEALAEKYDDDPRLAFLQVGFGLWAEYHIYSGPFILGETFPSKEFQKIFFDKLDSEFEETYWSISIDAASGTYSPFSVDEEYKNLHFGLFDDSFMHQGHSGYNTTSWNFFGTERYRVSPAGGEFSYYTSYDQQNVLNPDVGAHGFPYELFAQDFHISYIIGNDQPNYQSIERIKEASMRSGYKFKLNSVFSKQDSTIIELVNLGVAPIYVNAYLTVNGVRCTESLKLLSPDEPKLFHISAGDSNPIITIESDDILSTEKIQYFGTENEYIKYELPTNTDEYEIDNLTNKFSIYPTLLDTDILNIEHVDNQSFDLNIYNLNGQLIKSKTEVINGQIELGTLSCGSYFIQCTDNNGYSETQKIIKL